MTARAATARRPAATTGALLLCACLLGGCFHYRVSTGLTDSARGSATLVPLFWGLAEDSIDTHSVCQGNPVVEVQTTNNLGYALLTVLSVGIVAPAHVQWRCANDAPDAGANDF